jgi:hypothetical protein
VYEVFNVEDLSPRFQRDSKSTTIEFEGDLSSEGLMRYERS